MDDFKLNGKTLYFIRSSLGLSQQEIASLLGRANVTSISRVENGHDNFMNKSDSERLLKKLGLGAREFLAIQRTVRLIEEAYTRQQKLNGRGDA